MYTLVVAKKKQDLSFHDYIFKDFASFYEIANTLTVPLVGRYSIGIQSDNVNEIKDFIEKSDKYAAMIINIYAAENVVDYLSMYNNDLNVENQVNTFELFKELIGKKKLLISKKEVSLLYGSIPHDYDEMDMALSKIFDEFGPEVMITEQMLSTLFLLNKTMYPRQVLIAFLRMDRWRWSKLERCLKEMGNDVVLGAMVKNLKSLMQAKVTYFKTGKANNLVKALDTRNINLMYRILVAERTGLNDVTLLLVLYEQGLSSFDLMYEKE